MYENIKLVAFDLDGTLTQHKSKLSPEARATLEALNKKYKLLMVGAGMCLRIFNQMDQFPIDVLGNYGLQYAEYNPDTKELEIKENNVLPCDRESVEKRVTMLPAVLRSPSWAPRLLWLISWPLTLIVPSVVPFTRM